MCEDLTFLYGCVILIQQNRCLLMREGENEMYVADMHCDTISVLLRRQKKGEKVSLRSNDLMVDLEKMRQGEYLLQTFAAFVNYGRSGKRVGDDRPVLPADGTEYGLDPSGYLLDADRAQSARGLYVGAFIRGGGSRLQGQSSVSANPVPAGSAHDDAHM